MTRVERIGIMYDYRKQYVLRRKDTGEYLLGLRAEYLKRWPEGDPRRSNWTNDLSEADLYHFRQIRKVLNQYRGRAKTLVKFVGVCYANVEFEAVRTKILVDKVMDL